MSSLKTLILLAIIGLAFANLVEGKRMAFRKSSWDYLLAFIENVEEDADMTDFEDEGKNN